MPRQGQGQGRAPPCPLFALGGDHAALQRMGPRIQDGHPNATNATNASNATKKFAGLLAKATPGSPGRPTQQPSSPVPPLQPVGQCSAR